MNTQFSIRHIQTFLATSALALGLTIGCANAVFAQVQPQSYESIQYITGGIGNAEQNEMKSSQKDYNLLMTFSAVKDQAFLSDVAVQIVDKDNKKVFDVANTGPYLNVKLPDGKYELTATYKGETRKHAFTLAKGKAETAVLRWPTE